MSVNRTVRPWVPTIIFVAIVLLVIFAINYQTASKKPKKKGHRTHLRNRGADIPRTGDAAAASPAKDAWRDALPWKFAPPERFLPNYYSYFQFLNESDQDIYRKSNIVYLHVPKSGGTTMSKCFSSITKRIKKYPEYYGPIGENGIEGALQNYKKNNVTKATKVSLFSGEYAFGLCEKLDGKPCSYFLMLRDPLERLVSSYSFCKLHSNDDNNFFCALNVNNMSIVDWALTQRSFFFRQLLMTEDICKGKFDEEYDFEEILKLRRGLVKGKMPCWMKLQAILDYSLTKEERNGLLKYLSDSLEQWFAGVGILEDMDGTLGALDVVYRLPVFPHCRTMHANRTPIKSGKGGKKGDSGKKSKDAAKERLLQQLKNDARVTEALWEDIVLYKRVVDIAKLQREETRNVIMGI